MTKSKKNIILLGIIITLIISIIIVVLLLIINQKKYNGKIVEEEGVVERPLEKTLQKVTQRNLFYTIRSEEHTSELQSR